MRRLALSDGLMAIENSQGVRRYGKIKKHSPNVLDSLAEVYAVPYETVGGFRDRRSHGRKREGTPEVSGVSSLPKISFLGPLRLKLF